MSEPSADQAWTTSEHGEVEERPHAPAALDLRVARVMEARVHPNADRLLLLHVDAGEPAPRQLVAGIASEYAPEELAGKHVVIVANLQPARLRGELSQGMLLAAEGEGTLGLLFAPGAAPGTSVAATRAAPGAGQITIDDFRQHELVADESGVAIDGERVETPPLVVDRGVRGRLR